MTVSIDDTAIRLTGPCGVEEVETLVGYMDRHPDLYIDLSAATAVHTALWQAMMVFRPKMTGIPPFISGEVFDGVSAYLGENRPG